MCIACYLDSQLSQFHFLYYGGVWSILYCLVAVFFFLYERWLSLPVKKVHTQNLRSVTILVSCTVNFVY